MRSIVKRSGPLAIVTMTAVLSACSGGQQAGPLPSTPSEALGSSSSTVGSTAVTSATEATARTAAVVGSGNDVSTSSTTPYKAAVFSDHPSAMFQLSDTIPNAINDINPNLHGIYGSRVQHGGPSLTRDDEASSKFPGGTYAAENVVSVAPNSALTPSREISIDLWVDLTQSNSSGVDEGILAYGSRSSNANVPYAIVVTPRDTLKFIIYGGAPYYYWGYEESATLSTNKPHHVAATFDGYTERMYVDGQQTMSVKINGPLTYASNSFGLTIGSINESGIAGYTGFTGDLADVAIYPTVLSADRIAAHYAAGSGQAVIAPTTSPTSAPTTHPTGAPTSHPTTAPTSHPTTAPTSHPTTAPTAGPTGTPIPGSTHETPKTVFSFADSLGSDTHFNYTGTPYVTNQFPDAALLEQLPIRHLRDGGTGETAVMASLCSNGVHHSLGFVINITAAEIVEQLNAQNPACVDYVEPANEYDAQAYSSSGQLKIPNWTSQLMAEQKLIWTTIKGNPAFSHITVLGPGLASPGRYAQLSGISNYSDAASLHDGQCDGSPLTTHYHNAQYTHDLLQALYSTTKPIWTTEFAVANSTISGCGADLKTAAKYVTRQFLVRYNLGEPKNYQNEFSQVPANGGWGVLGMVDQSAHPYPAYTEMKSLIGALGSNQSASAAVSSLNYSLTGSTANVDHTLLQGNDGTYYMIMWVELDSWNHQTKSEIALPAQSVTLHLPSNVKTVTIANPTSGYTMATTSHSIAGSLSFSVTDSPLVVSFKL